jgi:actin-like ATPase involved in cell morphogenesis
MTAAHDAGLGSVRLVAEPFAAAIGADLPISAPNGTMIVECGAGTTEVAVLSLGGICLTRSVRVGGATLDKAIADHLHFKHKFLAGELTSERIKLGYREQRRAEAVKDETIQVKGAASRPDCPLPWRCRSRNSTRWPRSIPADRRCGSRSAERHTPNSARIFTNAVSCSRAEARQRRCSAP